MCPRYAKSLNLLELWWQRIRPSSSPHIRKTFTRSRRKVISYYQQWCFILIIVSQEWRATRWLSLLDVGRKGERTARLQSALSIGRGVWLWMNQRTHVMLLNGTMWSGRYHLLICNVNVTITKHLKYNSCTTRGEGRRKEDCFVCILILIFFLISNFCMIKCFVHNTWLTFYCL